MTVRFHLETLLYAALLRRSGSASAPRLTVDRPFSDGRSPLSHLDGCVFGIRLSGLAFTPAAHGGVRIMGQMAATDAGLVGYLDKMRAAHSYGLAVDPLLPKQTAVDLRFARLTLLPLSGDAAAFRAMEQESEELGDLVAAILAEDQTDTLMSVTG